MKLKHILLLPIMLLGLTSFAADDIFAQPKKQTLVVDNANVFSQAEVNNLTQKLNTFSNETSTQILVYTTNDLQGYDVADFAQRLGAGWKIGQKEFDNGIVIVFKPKTTDSPGRVTIQTGYGIEPLIPDITAKNIIENEMIPAFKQGEVFQGINNAVDICISLTKEEFTAATYNDIASKKSNDGAGIFFLLFIIILVVIFTSKRKNHYNAGTRSNLPLWAALFMLGSSSGRSSGWNNFSSGSGSFGGGSSFGGFGGGGFGGGGASGSW